MLKRIITGAVLVAAVTGFFLLKVFVHPALFEILILLLATVGSYEVATALGNRLLPVQKWTAVALSALTVPAAYFGLGLYALVLAAALQLAYMVVLYPKVPPEGAACALLATFYPSIFLILMTESNILPIYSLEILLLMFVTPSFADTFAFFTGSLVKGRKLCPELSPKKTVSGFIGGLVGGMLGAVAVCFIYRAAAGSSAPVWLYVIAGGLGALMTALGDLAESALKRFVGIKDMGKILPGHGGVMDRIDGICFACPVIFACFRLLIAFA